jgi:hypothetical protein
MNDRRIATAVGVFFIAATSLYIGGQAIYGSILGSPAETGLTSAQEARIVLGVLVELVGILAIPMISVFLYPVLRRASTPLAQGYVSLRVIESALLIVVAGFTLTLVGDRGGIAWPELREAVRLVSEPPFLISVGVVFPLSALILNAVLWATRLIPRGISAWGFLGGVALISGSLITLFDASVGLSPIAMEIVFSGPIAIQEMVLAVWLIVRGFSPEALANMNASRRGETGAG